MKRQKLYISYLKNIYAKKAKRYNILLKKEKRYRIFFSKQLVSIINNLSVFKKPAIRYILGFVKHFKLILKKWSKNKFNFTQLSNLFVKLKIMSSSNR